MFTGIVEELGSVKALRRDAGAARLTLSASPVLGGTVLGDSISVNGVCLTVVEMGKAEFSADVAAGDPESDEPGRSRAWAQQVNLERALQLSARIGGHLVCGHVDAVGRIRAKKRGGQLPGALPSILPHQSLRYIIKKGSWP